MGLAVALLVLNIFVILWCVLESVCQRYFEKLSRAEFFRM